MAEIAYSVHRMTVADNRGGAAESDEDVGSPERESPLQEGVDYYLENGLFVFTATFLRKRRYCCDSGCRHCPYKDSVP